ncbi:beta-1,4-galactosyltransferase 4 [Amblyraja radiata]|uniref:beta-1,4-galactosyltransferase 4 n=1 Tax=Amblyraja radiata TaxID=386614 RepID=UPI001403EAF9|nr:beta-1,4-galactosyltransferase 4 [Amblyraja radiata]XP_032889177.1 beta-1,4-galactosyltransferase 4 [Amblyraja radiata]XP_032889178.1 beta-1,4-galactosyltransferase 4 [Amblyraja radiata]
MACILTTRGFLSRIKLLLIIISFGSLVIWMIMGNAQNLVPEVSRQSVINTFWKMTKLDQERMTSMITPNITPSLNYLPLCPLLTPYLRGSTKLIFDPRLTLERTQKKNPKVQRGMFAPQECHSPQRVAILIPFRNREKHLLYLLEHLHPFLQRQLRDYGIYIINQAGNDVFNRAKLLNVGFLEALKERKWDCFIFHDVDLIPENDFNLYICDQEPKHFVVGRNSTGYRLRYRAYFGGVTAMSREQFLKVNGFSNRYWGWGGEDDDLWSRAQLQKMKLVRPAPEVARYTMTFHTRDKGNEVNRNRMKLLREVSKTWKTDGLNTCSYNTISQDHRPLYINITVDIGGPRRKPEMTKRSEPNLVGGV